MSLEIALQSFLHSMKLSEEAAVKSVLLGLGSTVSLRRRRLLSALGWGLPDALPLTVVDVDDHSS